jgi:hypothetical protein
LVDNSHRALAMSSYEPYHKTTIDCFKIRPHTRELVDRCGTAKAAGDYALVATSTIRRILHGTHCTVQQETARRILVALEHRRIEDRKNHAVHENLLKARQRAAQVERAGL